MNTFFILQFQKGTLPVIFLSRVLVYSFKMCNTGWTEDHRNFELHLNFLIHWEILKSFCLLKVRGIRFCLVYRARRLMAIWLRSEWGKLWQVSKCWFLDTLSKKIHSFSLCCLFHCIDHEHIGKESKIIWHIWSMSMENVGSKADFKFQESNVIFKWFLSVSENLHF